jgi:peroxiredoxin
MPIQRNPAPLARYLKDMSELFARRAFLGLLSTAAAFPALGQSLPSAPAFDVRTDTGKRIRLSDYQGKILLLTFWATWCPHCRRQITAMEKLRASYQKNNIEMLAISVDKEGWKIVAPYLEEHKLLLPVAIADARMQQQYRVDGGIPLSYIINQDGRVVKDFRGALDEEILQKLNDAIARSL